MLFAFHRSSGESDISDTAKSRTAYLHARHACCHCGIEAIRCAQQRGIRVYTVDAWVDKAKKEWLDHSPILGMDIDAGPVIMGLSPSGTAFSTGAATFFNDNEIRSNILRTAEICGNTLSSGNKKHYVLANIALVGEAIMLAMRTNAPANL